LVSDIKGLAQTEVENRVLRRIFGAKYSDKIVRGFRKLNNEKFYKIYSSPNMTMNKSGRMKWTGHVARKGK
jgi:hypothetical protein